MAVTLEQARLMQQQIGIHFGQGFFKQCLDEMRTYGVRRENCRKNQDKYLYAFQQIQLITFPSEYVPPKGTFGHAQT